MFLITNFPMYLKPMFIELAEQVEQEQVVWLYHFVMEKKGLI